MASREAWCDDDSMNARNYDHNRGATSSRARFFEACAFSEWRARRVDKGVFGNAPRGVMGVTRDGRVVGDVVEALGDDIGRSSLERVDDARDVGDDVERGSARGLRRGVVVDDETSRALIEDALEFTIENHL